MRSKTKKIIILIVSLLIILSISITSLKKTPVATTVVKKGSIQQTIAASGKIKAKNKASLSFSASGEITEILAQKGQEVKKGALLAKANTGGEYQSYLSKTALLEQAKANLSLIEKQYADNPDLSALGSEDVYWQKHKSLQESINSAQAMLNMASSSLADKYIYSPINGTVTNINYKVGEYANFGTPIIEVSDKSSLYFLAEINEEDFSLLAENQKVTIELESFPQKKFEGFVSSIPNYISTDKSGNIFYEIEINLADDLMSKAVDGMGGDIKIIIEEKENILIVDLGAIITEKDQTHVYKIQNGRALKTTVDLGLDGIFDIEILNGLQEKDIVILPENSKTIKDGLKIKPQN